MPRKLHLAYLTQSATVLKNGFFKDEIKIDRRSCSLPDALFTPYEKKEFIFCLRNTLNFLNLRFLFYSKEYMEITLGLMFVSKLSHLANWKMGEKFSTLFSDEIFTDFCQGILNLAVFPVAALVLISRSMSTLLKAIGAYDYNHSKKNAEADENNDERLLDDPVGLSVA